MKKLSEYIAESGTITKEEARKDYNTVDGLETKKEKQEYAQKYGVESVKKDEIKMAILLKLREFRKSASQFDDEDWYEFIRLEGYSAQKLPEYLKEENPKFVLWIKDYYYKRFFEKNKKLQNWIGMNPGNGAFGLSYADKDTIKFYNKLLTFIADNTPKTRTAKDEIFDLLVGKFTELLAEYKVQYLKKVEAYAILKYKSIPDDLEELKEKRKEEREKLDKIDWRKERYEYSQQYEIVDKLSKKIERMTSFLNKYTEKSYAEACVEKATEEFEDNIKILAHKIQDEGLEVDKLDVKSVKDDPKVFKMKITDGTKNLYCRSVLAAEFSQVMIPHYRFIITSRSKDDSEYKD